VDERQRHAAEGDYAMPTGRAVAFSLTRGAEWRVRPSGFRCSSISGVAALRRIGPSLAGPGIFPRGPRVDRVAASACGVNGVINSCR
jgi:hypothetical protein